MREIFPSFDNRKHRNQNRNVHIKWVDKTSRTLEQLVQKNELDFAVCLDSDPQKTVFSNRIIHSDPVYLCVSEKLLQQHYGEETKALKKKAINGAAVNDFIRLPFLMPESENRLGKVISECFSQENLAPLVRVQTTYTSILMPLCNAGLAAGFTSKMNLKEWISLFAEDVNIFPLYCNGSPVTQTVHVIYNKQRYLNRYTRYFLDLLEEYFQEIAQQDLTRLAPTLNSI
ncbi:MAG: LysR family transcriptional regulator substrate-binding protein [Lachnospiraceae bacterium]|nr:LysR family transcriptional regulator substrate-binding protein [Lachnospiraceae bacterium]MCD8124602.1 LysR family transcriptional regulator substrate-binding protein [Lachnospiraceae bacterium]